MLTDAINRYIEQRRAVGFKYRTQSSLLRHFAAFAESCNDEFVQTQSVLAWAGQAPSPQQQRNRLLTIRRFAHAMQAEDERHQIPPADGFGPAVFKRCAPHIFTAEELSAVLTAAAQLTPKGSMRPATYTTLFALMAATGLRSCEALGLKLKDLTPDGLIIRETKFRKSRLVPLHESTQRALERYLVQRLRINTDSDTVFVSHCGSSLPYSTTIAVFLSVLRSIGLRQGPSHPGPRLHDLRHTFAVRSLEQCGSDNRAVRRHISALSTYLGHAHVSDTYWYLQATPKLMTQIAGAGEQFFMGEQP